MKKFPLKAALLAVILTFTTLLAACGAAESNPTANSENSPASTASQSSSQSTSLSSSAVSSSEAVPDSSADESSHASTSENAAATAVAELYVRFGDSSPFAMHLYDNAAAAAIAHHVGTADWQLPIYHYDDYDNWEVMQYYDIPSRYEIPSNPESITAEQAGTVYYSEPNRIVLFFGDATVSGDYTPVGYFDVTEDFVSAVENNPVVQGWGNKLIHISDET